VMPSTGEGFGIVFLEAMASGIHVIAGDQDGSRDALCDGALGTLVEPENCEELASAIADALQRPTRTVDCATKFKTCLFAQHVHSLCRSLHLKDVATCSRTRPKFFSPSSTELTELESSIVQVRVRPPCRVGLFDAQPLRDDPDV
jgi:glycosyltransferase involved in cell wall biosynthesis